MTPRIKKHIRLAKIKAKKDPVEAVLNELDTSIEVAKQEIEENVQRKIEASLSREVLDEVLEYKRGEDGKTPEKGKEYYTEEEKEELIEEVLGRIRLPEDGKNADEDAILERLIEKIPPPQEIVLPEVKDGYTPQAGVDYPTEDQIRAMIATELDYLVANIPKGKVITKEEVTKIVNSIKSKIDWKENARDIARALETLKGNDALDYNALKNKPDLANRPRTLHRGGGGGVESVVAGTGVTVDNTDPANPIVSSSSGVQLVTSDPASATEGTLIVNTTTNEMKIYYGGTWQVLHTLTPASGVGIGTMIIGSTFVVA